MEIHRLQTANVEDPRSVLAVCGLESIVVPPGGVPSIEAYQEVETAIHRSKLFRRRRGEDDVVCFRICTWLAVVLMAGKTFSGWRNRAAEISEHA